MKRAPPTLSVDKAMAHVRASADLQGARLLIPPILSEPDPPALAVWFSRLQHELRAKAQNGLADTQNFTCLR